MYNKKQTNMKTFIKKFVSGFMNCVKSEDFWCMSVLIWTLCTIPEMYLLAGVWKPFENPERYQSDMSMCIFAVGLLILGAVIEWAVIYTEKD